MVISETLVVPIAMAAGPPIVVALPVSAFARKWSNSFTFTFNHTTAVRIGEWPNNKSEHDLKDYKMANIEMVPSGKITKYKYTNYKQTTIPKLRITRKGEPFDQIFNCQLSIITEIFLTFNRIVSIIDT